MSRFPKITETFILYEILAMRALGGNIEIYPLLRERQPVSHPEAARLTHEAHFQPFLSMAILKAHWHFVKRCPGRYFGVLAEVLTGTFRSPNFFVGTIGIFPKSVRFAYEMQRSGVDHVHAHFVTHPTVAALIIYRLIGIPFSFTAHGSDLHKDRTMLKGKVEASAFAVTISDYNKDMIIRDSGETFRDKVHVVHCGVEPDVFAYNPARHNQIFQILCVASFEEVKGHKYLIEACRILADQGMDFECHLVGEGPIRTRVERQIFESGICDRIHVHGSRPRAEVLQMLATADVKVLASIQTASGKREGIPIVLMEAMACGVPVVASRISGIPELVEDGVQGLLVPPGDANALAQAIQSLSSEKKFAHRLAANARDKIVHEFDLRKNAAQLLTLIQKSAEKDKKKRASKSQRIAAQQHRRVRIPL